MALAATLCRAEATEWQHLIQRRISGEPSRQLLCWERAGDRLSDPGLLSALACRQHTVRSSRPAPTEAASCSALLSLLCLGPSGNLCRPPPAGSASDRSLLTLLQAAVQALDGAGQARRIPALASRLAGQGAAVVQQLPQLLVPARRRACSGRAKKGQTWATRRGGQPLLPNHSQLRICKALPAGCNPA